MKLSTTIPPRRDGTVRARGADGVDYVFARSPGGDLECDIADEATIAQLLGTGMFHPADPQDFDAAIEIEDSVVLEPAVEAESEHLAQDSQPRRRGRRAG